MNIVVIRSIRRTLAFALMSIFCLSNASAQVPRYRVRDLSYDTLSFWSVDSLNNSGEIVVSGFVDLVNYQIGSIYRWGEYVRNYGANQSFSRIDDEGNTLRNAAGVRSFYNVRTGVETLVPTNIPHIFRDFRGHYGVGYQGSSGQQRPFLWHDGVFIDPNPTNLYWFGSLGLCNQHGKAISSDGYGYLSFWNGTGAEQYVLPLSGDNTSISLLDFNNVEKMIGRYESGSQAGNFFGDRNGVVYLAEEYFPILLNNRNETIGVRRSIATSSALSHAGGQWYPINDGLPEEYSAKQFEATCLNDYGQIGGMTQTDYRALILAPQARVNGTVQSNALSLAGRSVAVTMQSNLPQVTENIAVGANGAATLDVDKDVPTVTLRFHAPHHLVKAISLTATADDTPFGTVSLIAGDANDDNAIDIADLLILIAHYNQFVPAADYLEATDFNSDGANDLADLLLLVANYNRLGD